MRSGLHNASIIDIHNLIAVADRRQPVRNNKGCASLEHCIQSGLQIFFCLHIDTGSCLIKDQDGRIRQKCSCKRDQLLLTLAEHGTLR